MKKLLLSIAVVLTALTANAQKLTGNSTNVADEAKMEFTMSAPNSIVSNVVYEQISKAEGEASAAVTWIEVETERTQGSAEDQVVMTNTSAVTYQLTGNSGDYNGATYPEVSLKGLAGGYCTAKGYLDDAAGKIYIPRQVGYVHPDATKGYGNMYIEAYVVNEAGTGLKADGVDLILFRQPEGRWAAYEGSNPGNICGIIVTMPEYGDGTSVWKTSIAPEYIASNGVEAGYYNTGSGWSQKSYPVAIVKTDDGADVYNFVGAGLAKMLFDETDVYIAKDQPVGFTMRSPNDDTAVYGEYTRIVPYKRNEGRITVDDEAEFVMAVLSEKAITMDNDGYFGVWSKFTPEGSGYRFGIFSALSWTLNEGEESFITTGISDVNISTAKGDNKFYNLSGQRVSSNTPGIVIRNGKKFINK